MTGIREVTPRRGLAITWLAALLLTPWVLRVVLIGERGSAGVADLRGLLSDLAIAGVVWLLAAQLLRSPAIGLRLVGVVTIAVFAFLQVAADEYLRTLGATATLDHAAYLGDATFLFGSVLPILAGWRFWLAMTSIAALILASRSRAWGSRGVRLIPALAMVVIGLVILALWPRVDDAAGWRQANVVEDNVRWLVTDARRPAVELPEPGLIERRVGDLSGEPIVPLGTRTTARSTSAAEGRPPNVVLILLEGVTGGYLPSLAAANDMPELPRYMPGLDAIAERSIAYSSFIALQRQTNRGEYAILCGEAPKLASAEPKMSELVRDGHGPSLPCLPAVLRDAGYRTVYLQASPLPFMFKDQFMPRAGFERVYGDEVFDNPRSHRQWGVDDESFFDQAFELTSELRAADEPFFLTLLTVGTHHPFNVPDDYKVPDDHENDFRAGSFPWALSYLDGAISRFIEQLEAAGARDDTLILITSDEAVGLPQADDDVSQMLSQAWSLLLAMPPSGEQQRVATPFLHTDLPLSIVDYLGIGEQDSRGETFGGRSVFRTYDRPRTLVFGNTYLRRVAGVGVDGALTSCLEDFTGCSRWRLEAGPLSPRRQRIAGGESVEAPGFLRRAVLASLGPTSPRARSYELIADGAMALEPRADRQWIFSGQFLSAPPGSRIDVDIEVMLAAEGDASGGERRAWLIHDLWQREEKIHEQGVELGVGDSVTFRYAYGVPADGLDRIENRLWVIKLLGEGLRLDIERATLRIDPSPEDPVPVGVFDLQPIF